MRNRLRLLTAVTLVGGIVACGPSAEQCRAWKEAARDTSNLAGMLKPLSDLERNLVAENAAEQSIGTAKIEQCRKLGYW